MEGIGPAHPVLPLEQFSGHISQGKRSELNWLRLGKGSYSRHEEVQIRERDGVDAHFPETSIQLTRESGGGSDPTHGSRDQRIQVEVGRLLNLQFFMAQTEQRLIVKCDDHICTFDERLHS